MGWLTVKNTAHHSPYPYQVLHLIGHGPSQSLSSSSPSLDWTFADVSKLDFNGFWVFVQHGEYFYIFFQKQNELKKKLLLAYVSLMSLRLKKTK